MSILLLLTIISVAHGQTISFDYDADGNMESRYVVTLRAAEMIAEEEVISTVELPGQKITIYPNPTQGRISIEITPAIPERNNFLRLYDMGGRIIKSQKIGDVRTEMEIRGYPGIYLLDIHLDGEISKWKIIKQ